LQNTPVRWQGILIDHHHGMTLIAEDCRRRGIDVQEWPFASDLRWRGPGIVRVDVSGLITVEGRLSVSDVHRIEFQSLGEQQVKDLWRSMGF
jgi:hypothetical protein